MNIRSHLALGAVVIFGLSSQGFALCPRSPNLIAVCDALKSDITNYKALRQVVETENLCLAKSYGLLNPDGTGIESTQVLQLAGSQYYSLKPTSADQLTVTGSLMKSKNSKVTQTEAQILIQSQAQVDFGKHKYTVVLDQRNYKMRVTEKTAGWLFGLGAKTIVDFEVQCKKPCEVWPTAAYCQKDNASL